MGPFLKGGKCGIGEMGIEEKDWESTKIKLLEEFKWQLQGTTREKDKGRDSGVQITGVRECREEKELTKDTVNVL